MVWKAILKPKTKPPRVVVPQKKKTSQPRVVPGSPEPAPDNEFEQLHEKCMCNLPKCRRKAIWGCHWCTARLCNYHKNEVTSRLVGEDQRESEHIHNFGAGKCEGEEWVFK